MNKKTDFVDELMNKAFDLEAPEIPDFAQCEENNDVMELNFEQLDYLAAAGAAEIRLKQKYTELLANRNKKNNG